MRTRVELTRCGAVRRRRGGLETGFALTCGRLLAALLLVSAAGWASAGTTTRPVTLEGTLIDTSGGCAVLHTQTQAITLTARTTWLLHTLEDKRLANREIQVQGELNEPGGTLKVDKFYTVRNGKLFRVRYFCETCNLEALEPGLCICCQQPTELQEVPVK